MSTEASNAPVSVARPALKASGRAVVSLAAPSSLEAPQVRTFYVPMTPVRDPLLYAGAKRLLDVVVASVALLLLFPLFVVVGFLIWREDRGPAIYRQWRVGKYGVPIRFYKFRSMRTDADRIREQLLAQNDAEGVAFKMKDDPRITRVGRLLRKYSIDELPQFFSVLSGQMSIVGPRPLPLSEGYACAEGQTARYLVKPGLLCFREVSGRSRLTFDEWMRLDAEYVASRSFWLDLRIMARAIPAVLRADGAY